MEQQKYLDDLREIRDIMNRSSRFLSLSGWSGISAGIIALAGVYLGYVIVYAEQDSSGFERVDLTHDHLISLLLVTLLTLGLAIVAGVFFTTRKARRRNQKVWDAQAKRLLVNLLIPLVTGGILCLLLLAKGFLGLLAPFTLIFYGLALVNASKYTFSEVRSLGILEIVLGLIATYFIEYGLIFWAVGFGMLHIIYGILMEVRYQS